MQSSSTVNRIPQDDEMSTDTFDNDRRSGGDPSGDPLMSDQLAANFAKLREHPGPQNAELAKETALLVQQEVGRMERSVAELEALLEAHGESTGNDSNDESSRQNLPKGAAFPNLPRVVMVQSDDETDGDSSSQG